ncbi:MAG TPA: 2-oxoglutarate dehydrogenase E1 component [Kofleriaceae bacterium]|nr:2-oxoglutarate dehydrogenase E1 component [Kofleriaceae bacterium]
MSFDPVVLGSSVALVEELYERYKKDPEAIDPGWRQLFENGLSLPVSAYRPPPPVRVPDVAASAAPSGVRVSQESGLSTWPLVNAYRVRGHMAADLDPLGLIQRPRTTELEPATYGFGEADLDRVFPAGGLAGVERATLREILAKLKRTYGASIGLEYMHISTPAKKQWLSQRMETLDQRELPRAVRLRMLEQLVAAETIERFCHVKYPGTKRFSVEGGESMVPLLDLILAHATRLGAVEAVVGMAHRGRLNVLTNIMGRAPREVFAEFYDIEPEATLGGGDVKYHLGYSCDRDYDGKQLHVSLSFNPSHLEAVDPVVVGRVRAKQRRHQDFEHRRVIGVLIHGDAAFAGQGLVPETLNLTNLHGYRTGGTVHLIVNNQIGFTASPQESRSTPYCTDVAKMIQCPIFHVNGEDLDAVAAVAELALEYRAQFQSDVVIDMFCYRKFGHNEMDEPSFTQPLMYKRVQEKRPVVELYSERLLADGVIERGDVEAMTASMRAALEEELTAAQATAKRPRVEAMRGVWSAYLGGPETLVADIDTGVARERLAEIAARITEIPEDFRAHSKIKRLMSQRAEMGRGERSLDWGMGELLAFGSLLWDGVTIRLSGQDSSRGTFSHRHALITDIESGSEYMPLSNLHPEQASCRIYDSPLSEAGVLGFDYGFSLDFPDALVMWEAQFGDFANGAQVIIDQFIGASEDKWHRLSGLVMLLPHGYEGQGPEHSSARMERFLQNAAEDCYQVCQPTTPAQMFHMLRRQVIRPWRKPLIVLTPKSLLRHPDAVSSIDELTHGRFRRVIGDPVAPPAEQVERVFLCSGKIYYDLVSERRDRNDSRTALVRIEQLYPWRPEELRVAIDGFPTLRELVWVQDEPLNMGAWTFLMPRLTGLFGAERLRVVGRAESASPATGSHKAHAIEHEMLMREAFEPR